MESVAELLQYCATTCIFHALFSQMESGLLCGSETTLIYPKTITNISNAACLYACVLFNLTNVVTL